MANNANAAKQLLKHYFRLVAKQSGVAWDSDNESEVEQIVDLIVAAAVDEVPGALRAQRQEDDEAGESWQSYQEFKRQRNKAMGYE